MFCNQCGMEVPEGGAFCPNCGNKMDNVVQTSEDAGTVIGNEREGQEQGKILPQLRNRKQRGGHFL